MKLINILLAIVAGGVLFSLIWSVVDANKRDMQSIFESQQQQIYEADQKAIEAEQARIEAEKQAQAKASKPKTIYQTPTSKSLNVPLPPVPPKLEPITIPPIIDYYDPSDTVWPTIPTYEPPSVKCGVYPLGPCVAPGVNQPM